MQSFFAPKPTMASAASTAAPSTTNPSPPPKLRSLFRCVVLANAGDEPNLKRILCVSAEGWIERYHSDPASASVELADTTMRLAERIDRQQVGLAGNPPPPVRRMLPSPSRQGHRHSLVFGQARGGYTA